MAKVVLFGNGQIASVVYEYLTRDSPHEVVAFTVDRDYLVEHELFGLPIVPFEEVEAYFPPSEYAMFVSISYRQVNRLRAEKYHAAKAKGYELISYVHSKASVWPELEIGDNCFIMEQNVIQPFVRIGNDVIIWSGNHIGHHTTIQDHCFLASHVVIAGYVKVEPYCFFGINATVRDGITIGEACVVGAGALVLHDAEPRGVYIGHGAERIPKSSDQLRNI